jgi:addiction module HigA family antidote
MIEQRSYRPSDVSVPGDTLKEILEERGITQADLAIRMGRPQKTISEIANGKTAITTETALELELVLGVPAAFWLSREARYREWLARSEQENDLADARSWCELFPTKQMEQFGWLPRVSDWRQRSKALLEFLGVASPSQWNAVQDCTAVAFRRPRKFQSNPYALAAWLRAGERTAQSANTAPYNREKFLAALAEIRAATREPPSVFTVTVPQATAEAGVVVAFIPELPASRASGATRWLTPSRALIQLSLRYKTDDHLWFTFFHEAAHVLLHSKKMIFIEAMGHSGKEEEEANAWARDFLIPVDDYRALATWPVYTKAAVSDFASHLGIAPGIVVGRLQHDGLLPHSHLNDLKRRFQWDIRVAS